MKKHVLRLMLVSWLAGFAYAQVNLDPRAQMISPAPGSTLPGATVTFTWTAADGGGGANYILRVGSVPLGADIANALVRVTSATVGNLPTNGGTVYVTLYTQLKGAFQAPFEYTYTAAGVPPPALTTITVDNKALAFSSAPQNVTLTATLGATGTVNQGTVTFQVMDGASNIGSAVTSAALTTGSASVSYVLPAGTPAKSYAILATYSGGPNFQAAAGAGTLTISPAPQPTPAAITLTVNNQVVAFSGVPQNVTLTATLSASATVNQGTVTFQVMDGASNLGTAVTSAVLTTGSASVSYVLPAGTPAKSYAILATYSGGPNFQAGAGAGTLTVSPAPQPAPAATTLAVDNQTVAFSGAAQNVTLTATVGAAATVNQGTVTFQVKDGAIDIGTAVTSAGLTTGSASVTYALPAATLAKNYTILATYSGGPNFQASTGAGMLTVGPAPATPAVTTLTVDNKLVTFSGASQNVTLTATVAPASAVNQGTVTFQVMDGAANIGTAVTSATLTTGSASVTYALPPATLPRNYTVLATYSGGSNFQASAATGMLSVSLAPPSPALATLTVDNKTVAFSSTPQSVPLTATVAAALAVNQGTVTFQVKDGANSIGSAVTSPVLATGSASVNCLLPAGTVPKTYTIQATYVGGPTLLAVGGVGTLTVSPPASAIAPTTMTVETRSVVFSNLSQSVTLTATVAAASPVSQGSVTFQVMDGTGKLGAAVTSATLTASRASVTYVLPAGTAARNYTIQATYSGGSGFLPATAAGTLIVSPAPPPAALAAVTNSASYGKSSIAPGEIVTLFGAGLGSANLAYFALDGDNRIPASLAGVRVLFNGIPAPLIYTSDKQTAVIVPFELAGQHTAQVQVERNGVASAAFTVPVTNTMPGIYSANSSGSGLGAIQNADLSYNSASNPAAPGTIVVLYVTGLGQLNPAPPAGSIVAAPLPVLSYPVTVTIAGQPAALVYAGPAPQAVAGLYQVNCIVPDGVASGPASVVVAADGRQSQPNLTVAIK